MIYYIITRHNTHRILINIESLMHFLLLQRKKKRYYSCFSAFLFFHFLKCSSEEGTLKSAEHMFSVTVYLL